MNPKGKLLIIGGHEDRDGTDVKMEEKNSEFISHEILKLLTSDNNRRIEVITTASSEPESMRDTYQKTFDEIGYTNFGFMHILPEQADEDLDRLKNAGVIFFTGGDQNTLCKALKDTQANKLLIEKYQNEEDFLIAGTSAGAMCMPEIIIDEGEEGEAMLKGDIKLGLGLNLLPRCIVDTHFIHRGRFGRLSHAVIIRQDCVGIGLGEDTALLIENGHRATCKGSGMTVIIDPKNISRTNIERVEKGDPVFAENLVVHLYTDGCSFDLRQDEEGAPDGGYH
ncbi:cyanophycinase [Chryseobacterium sp. JJR-5R]|uniref:cyanophycinase n=1 Tax=Chryseobacterium sp. JJR-5R TaxID=3093923 RepID=UPI002A74DDE3|nr:cyanophycinase [Chryseobacterium sp. JJR-5R]WPO81534.1 cyanophycinase [Chryseobacterium sp. JJR-5R]